MAEIARDCFESGQREINFLRGFEDWKRDWTDEFRWNAMLTDLHGGDSLDLPMCAVALRELLDWAQVAAHRS